MSGKTETKTGEKEIPSILYTLIISFKLIFFNDRVLFRIFLDNRLTFNLITIFLIMLAMPLKVFTTGEIFFMEPGRYVENVLLTVFFILILYITVPKKKIHILSFFRIFLAFEVVDIFGIPTIFMSGHILSFYTAILVGWYLSLSVYAISRFSNIGYTLGVFHVFFAFIAANFIPVLFGAG